MPSTVGGALMYVSRIFIFYEAKERSTTLVIHFSVEVYIEVFCSANVRKGG